MVRLYDRMRASGITIPTLVRENHPHMVEASVEFLNEAREKNAVVVDATSVANHMYREVGQDVWYLGKDIPYVMPPFDICFIEYKNPGFTEGSEHFRDNRDRVGLLLKTHDREEYLDRMASRSKEALRPGENVDARLLDARWIVEGMMFIQLSGMKERVWGPVAVWFVPVLETGAPIMSEDGFGAYRIMPLVVGEEDIAEHPDLEIGYSPFAEPVFFAISLMHCKNVRTVENVPPTKLSRRHQKRKGVPLTRYYTLEVDEVAPVRKDREEEAASGVRRAKHLRRGHFKTFTQEKPLFGRYSGTWWWGPRFVGDLSAGRVDKDYAVKGRAIH